MKKYTLLALFTLFCFVISGQAKQQVIATAGGYKLKDNTISLSWTLGETITPTSKSSDGFLILTHGFQQIIVITAMEEEILNPVSVIVYPNPASERVMIRFDTPVTGEVKLLMTDGNGKIVLNETIGDSVIEHEVNLQNFSPGLYFIRLVKGNHINVYRVVKL